MIIHKMNGNLLPWHKKWLKRADSWGCTVEVCDSGWDFCVMVVIHWKNSSGWWCVDMTDTDKGVLLPYCEDGRCKENTKAFKEGIKRQIASRPDGYKRPIKEFRC